jgi:hypothetical protein
LLANRRATAEHIRVGRNANSSQISSAGRSSADETRKAHTMLYRAGPANPRSVFHRAATIRFRGVELISCSLFQSTQRGLSAATLCWDRCCDRSLYVSIHAALVRRCDGLKSRLDLLGISCFNPRSAELKRCDRAVFATENVGGAVFQSTQRRLSAATSSQHLLRLLVQGRCDLALKRQILFQSTQRG